MCKNRFFQSLFLWLSSIRFNSFCSHIYFYVIPFWSFQELFKTAYTKYDPKTTIVPFWAGFECEWQQQNVWKNGDWWFYSNANWWSVESLQKNTKTNYGHGQCSIVIIESVERRENHTHKFSKEEKKIHFLQHSFRLTQLLIHNVSHITSNKL